MGADPDPAMESSVLTSADTSKVRSWLSEHNPKSLSLLDKFLMELRMDRRAPKSQTTLQSSSASSDRRFAVHKTVELLKHLIGSTKWMTAAELLRLLRGLGHELHAATIEPAIGNVVRRTMAAVREEVAQEDHQEAATVGGRLQSMLWALPQQQRSRSRSFGADRHDSSSSNPADDSAHDPADAPLHRHRPNLKQAVLEAMDEITSDLEDLHRNVNEQAAQHIHPGEIILTCGRRSKTVELFLKAAAAAHNKKQQRNNSSSNATSNNFQVFVCEGAPRCEGLALAQSLRDAGIASVVTIPDSAAFAVMARVHKVLLPAHAVLANGGLVASSGCHSITAAAHHFAVPVVCVTGMFKLCPMYPHDGQDTLNDLESPAHVLEYAALSDPVLNSSSGSGGGVELVNPVHDYIPPELVNLYITNVGAFQPNYIYRLLSEYYHADDWESFDD